jgi:membrane-associated phospholipid phosphatase
MIANYIGEYFPFVIIVVALGWIQFIYLFVGVAFNLLINLILKNFFQAKRPIPNLHTDYGMPSGHSQMATFVTTLIYFHNFRLFILSSLFCFVTFWQRIHYRHHFLSQVVVGATLGIILALFYRWFYKKYLKNY